MDANLYVSKRDIINFGISRRRWFLKRDICGDLKVGIIKHIYFRWESEILEIYDNNNFLINRSLTYCDNLLDE